MSDKPVHELTIEIKGRLADENAELHDLAGQIIASLRVNLMRGTLQVIEGGQPDLERMLDAWSERLGRCKTGKVSLVKELRADINRLNALVETKSQTADQLRQELNRLRAGRGGKS